MPTTTNAAGVSVTLKPGEVLTVSATGVAHIDFLAGVVGAGYTSIRVLPGIPRQIGPYAGNASFRVRAGAGVATYEVTDPNAIPAVSTQRFDEAFARTNNA
jgi:hypothetical protein